MRTPACIVAYGFLAWLIPLLVSMAVFPLKRTDPPAFETVMPIVLAAVSVCFGLLYLRRAPSGARAMVAIGAMWAAMSCALDLPMFLWGPMKMPIAAYFMDIGGTYLIYPVVLAGLGAAARPLAPPHSGHAASSVKPARS